MKEDKNYWMHRISYERDIKQDLLDKEGMLLTGWGALSNDSFLDTIYGKDKKTFDKIYKTVFSVLPHNRYFLYMFINEYKKGDYVLVPGNKDFSIYEIVSERPFSKDHILENLKNPDAYNLERDNVMIYRRKDSQTELELGFFWKVKSVELNISREQYADDKLRRRMKFQGTDNNITDLASQVEESIIRHRKESPFILREEIINETCSAVYNKLQTVASDSGLEKVVKFYMERLGATRVDIPHKSRLSKDQGDIDVVADFDELQVRVIIQVKHYQDAVGVNAVQQIIDAKSFYDDSSHTVISWVIASCDVFMEDAQRLAEENGIRLMGGSEFARSLLDVGFNGLVI